MVCGAACNTFYMNMYYRVGDSQSLYWHVPCGHNLTTEKPPRSSIQPKICLWLLCELGARASGSTVGCLPLPQKCSCKHNHSRDICNSAQQNWVAQIYWSARHCICPLTQEVTMAWYVPFEPPCHYSPNNKYWFCYFVLRKERKPTYLYLKNKITCQSLLYRHGNL